MGYGDEILAAGQAQRLYDAGHTPVLILDRHSKPRWHEIWQSNPAIVHPDHVQEHEWHQVLQSGPHCRPYIVYPFDEDTGWTFNKQFRARDHVAKIYLTPAEEQFARDVRRRYGPYVLVEPHSKHHNLRWPMRHWQELMTLCPGVTFLQHIHQSTGDFRIVGIPAEFATFRDACALVSRATVYIRGESGMCHAAAALDRPQITIWGGCMDWDVLGGYAQQLGVGIDRGPRSPCGCWRACGHCAEIMQAITPKAVATALYSVMSALVQIN